MRYIADLRDGENIKEVYLCKVFQQMKTKAGKTYYSLTLQDKTGSLDAKVWDMGSAIEHCETMDYIQVEGQITTFQNALQLNIRRLRKCKEGEYDPSEYLPATTKDIKKMYAELTDFIQKIKEPHMKKLMEAFFIEDKDFAKKFQMHSAAKNVHHSFIGGLLEHTLSVTRLCTHFVAEYPQLKYDLLIPAAMCHDIGKIYELSNFPENDYTDDGNLIGHIVIGTEMVKERAVKIEGFPPKLLSELRHCILAHHGELEYGSPKKPAIAEAIALNFADNMDAKMETIKEILQAADSKLEWVGYQKLFESNIRRTV